MLASCLNCGTKLEVSEDLRGQAVRCTKCKRVVWVPNSPPPEENAEIIHFIITPNVPFVLSPDQAAVIGREPDCDIHLDDQCISRRHARIFWSEDGYEIEDLDSMNGIFVNHLPVKRAKLKHKTQISIGSIGLVFRQAKDMEEMRQACRKARQGPDEKTETREMKNLLQQARSNQLSGALSSVSLAEICQMIQLGMRDGALCLYQDSDKIASLHFRLGRLVHAELGDRSGEEVVPAILALRQGTFILREDLRCTEHSVRRALSFFLLDSARRHDEHGTSQHRRV